MAARWVLFAAHGCNLLRGSGGHQPTQPMDESCTSHDPVVRHTARLVVELRLLGPTAELITQEHVADVGFRQQFPQARLPEVG